MIRNPFSMASMQMIHKHRFASVGLGSLAFALLASIASGAPPTIRDSVSGRSGKRTDQHGRHAATLCVVDADCNDHDPCTTDVCFDGVCINTPIPKCDPECVVGADCTDDDVCTLDVCIDGLCDNRPIDGCTPPCAVDSDCDDGNGCTTDRCADAVCTHDDIPDCVPCDPAVACPPMDVVFLVDTSASMAAEAGALCAAIPQMVTDLAAQGIVVSAHLYGITETPPVGFPCLTGTIVDLYGSAVPDGGTIPDPATCEFPNGSAPYESWGPATAIVAQEFAWTPGAQRLIVPVSDEAACNGSIPEGCGDPGDDRDALDNAMAVAIANHVIVSPILGTGTEACVANLAADIAAGTGGRSFVSQIPEEDLGAAVRDMLTFLCEAGDPCNDDNICTEDTCGPSGVCGNEPTFDDTVDCCNPADGALTPIDDGDLCTSDVCDGATGQVSHPPSDAGTTCDDGDGCTENDICDGQGNCAGTGINCDDGNACTDDICEGGQCTHPSNFDEAVHCCNPADGGLTPLEDEDPCTAGVCDAATGQVTQAPAADGTACSDGSACTDDACQGGACIGTPNHDESVTCCNPADGTLTEIDDGNDCTRDRCNPKTGGVSHPPTDAGLPCDDGDGCTDPDVCDGLGRCSGTAIDCGDDNACTDDICRVGECDHVNNFDEAVHCCNPADGGLTPLEDDDPCTLEICDPSTGEVTHPPADDGTACDDGNACTDDACANGECVGTANFDDATLCCNPATGELANLHDGDPCTRDLCDAATGEVTHPPADDGTSCDDGNACTDDACVNGACTGTANFDDAVQCCDPTTGTLTALEDGDPCTVGVCDSQTGQVSQTPAPDGTACDDGNACTDDACANGECVSTTNFDEAVYCCDPVSGSLVDLEDGDPCTVGVCDAQTGQVTQLPAEDGTACDDGNACTDDACQAGACVSTDNFDPTLSCCNPLTGSVEAIDDGNDCTRDLCNADTGEVSHPPTDAGTPCDDGDLCTTPDLCNGLGACIGSPVECDDGNACTDDFCVSGDCLFIENYDDAVVCCDPADGGLTPLDDGDPCTVGVCDASTGLVTFVPAADGTACDDGSACTDDQCESGVCVGTANHDETVTCCDPGSGVLTVIDDDNKCTDDTCDPQTGEVVHSPVADGTSCDDGNACTNDACVGGVCEATPNYDEAVFCCTPDGGVLTEIDDGDACTDDVCDVDTGLVTHPFSEAGTPCDDGNTCTTDDACDGAGGCAGTSINEIPCGDGQTCPEPGTCDTESGICVCPVDLCLEAVGNDPDVGCHPASDLLVVNVTVDNATAVITGGQFVIPYDPSILEFVSIAPGNTYDPNSPFTFEIFRDIDEVAGLIVYAVGVEPDRQGTSGSMTLATIQFLPLEPCGGTELCFISENPLNTLLSDENANKVPYTPCCTGPVDFDEGPPTLNCPDSVDTNPIPGQLQALVTWDPIVATDGCDGAPTLVCTATDSLGNDISHLINAGGLFPFGRSELECTATDSCGGSTTCSWYVDVSNQHTLEVAIQISPTLAPGPLQRCIEFELFSSCIEQPERVLRTIQFGLPYDLPGFATKIRFKVPAGQYACLTARDPLHTLRSASIVSVVDNIYVAEFLGDPFFGGNWLPAGNLDGSRVIDALDAAVFIGQQGMVMDPDTPCDTVGPHADINGDGIVDQADWTFIDLNFLEEDKGACCPGSGAAAAPPVARTSVTIEQLRALGLGAYRSADLNGDGVIDSGDFDLYRSGARTKRATRRQGAEATNTAPVGRQ